MGANAGNWGHSRRRLEVWEQRLQPSVPRCLGAEPPALGDFYEFSIKNNAFLGILRLKFLL